MTAKKNHCAVVVANSILPLQLTWLTSSPCSSLKTVFNYSEILQAVGMPLLPILFFAVSQSAPAKNQPARLFFD